MEQELKQEKKSVQQNRESGITGSSNNNKIERGKWREQKERMGTKKML